MLEKNIFIVKKANKSLISKIKQMILNTCHDPYNIDKIISTIFAPIRKMSTLY